MAIIFEQGAPNLDCEMSADDVWEAAEKMCMNTRKLARVMFPNRPKGYVSATTNLSHYAYNKATAMRCRLRGDIVAAQNYESICQRIYDRLPEFARW